MQFTATQGIKMTDTNLSSMDKFLTEDEELNITSLSKVTRWRLEKRGDYPKRFKLSPNRSARRQSEVLAWIKSRPESDIRPTLNQQETNDG